MISLSDLLTELIARAVTDQPTRIPVQWVTRMRNRGFTVADDGTIDDTLSALVLALDKACKNANVWPLTVLVKGVQERKVAEVDAGIANVPNILPRLQQEKADVEAIVIDDDPGPDAAAEAGAAGK